MSRLKKGLQTDTRTCTPAQSDAYLSLSPLKTHSIAFVTVLVDTLVELFRYAWKQIRLILFLNIYHTLQNTTLLQRLH